MNHILICLLVIKLASIKFATYSQRIASLSLMKENSISSDGCTDARDCSSQGSALIELNALTCSFNFNFILAQYSIKKKCYASSYFARF